jgi:carbohydrate-binding DOMON domain-containing protein
VSCKRQFAAEGQCLDPSNYDNSCDKQFWSLKRCHAFALCPEAARVLYDESRYTDTHTHTHTQKTTQTYTHTHTHTHAHTHTHTHTHAHAHSDEGSLNKREKRAKKVAANKTIQACIGPHYGELMKGLSCV